MGDARLDTTGPWLAICFCLFLTSLIAIATGMHVSAKRRADESERDEALLEEGSVRQAPRLPVVYRAFSLIGPDGTWEKLWAIPSYKPTDCLNGLRALSMFWVVLGHSFLMPEGIMGYQNPQDIVVSPLNAAAAEDNWLFMFVLSSQLSVDSFFFLGGFLFSLLTVKELENRRGKLNYGMVCVLRYLRLTPSLAFVMLVYYMILPMLANGPFAPKFQHSVFRRCDISWWSELLYLQNFIPFNSDDVCMGWTWYLGDDMIFFIVGLFLVPIYYFRRVAGWSIAILLMAASTIIMGYLTVVHHLAPEALDGYHQQEYFLWAYSKPYTRIPAYLVGVMAAWILLEMEKKGITIQTGMCGPMTSSVLWFFAIGVQTFIVCIPATDHGHRANSWSDNTSFLYMVFSRTVWAACWAILTFLCYFGQAPVTNWILSHPIWTPFARLTYGAYLCHPLVIKLASGSAEQYYNFNGMFLVYHVTGNILCSYGCSFLVWCMVERPMMTFTTALIKSKGGAKAAKVKEAAPGPEVVAAAKEVVAAAALLAATVPGK